MSSRPDCNEFRRTRVTARFVLTALAVASGSVAALAPGADGVRVTIPITGISDSAQGGVVDTNGNIVLAGSAGGGKTALARLTPNGTLDGTFGTAGVAINDLSVNLSDALRAIVRMDDGRYVACGTFFSAGTATDFVVARFNSNGSLDGTFNGSGYAVTSFLPSGAGGSLFDQCNAVALQPDGMIVSAGFTAENGPNHVALTRHTTSGALDGGFGSGGKVDINASFAVNGNSEARALVVQPDGKLLVAGYAFGPGNAEFLVMRLNADGSPDGSFGSAGITRTPVGPGEDIANAMVRQPDGRIVLAGSAIVADGRRDFALARYTTAGVLDASFGSGGLVTTPVGPSDDVAYALELMPWGRLIAAGSARTSTGGSGTDLALVSYNANGSVDAYFGDAGKRMVNISTFDDIIYGLASDIGGTRFWAVGTAAPSTTAQDFLAIEFGLNDTIFRDGFEGP
ncbi:MAG: delta-60 repeat domain-containing protein [Dokdonella sp.]